MKQDPFPVKRIKGLAAVIHHITEENTSGMPFLTPLKNRAS